MGKKVIDSRLTVKNLTDLEEYNGKKLVGAYMVDIEGVTPPAAITLIENGLFRRTMNSSIPTDISSESTGSLCFGSATGQGSTDIYPGVLHITATGTETTENLRGKLIEYAKEQGNDCAYIVRTVGSNPELYRVDVETGAETRVRSANVPVPALNKLDRLLGISDTEQIINDQVGGSVLVSIICPTAIIVEDIEITPRETKKEQSFFTKNPLKR